MQLRLSKGIRYSKDQLLVRQVSRDSESIDEYRTKTYKNILKCYMVSKKFSRPKKLQV